MPKIQAYKCPKTKKIFETRAAYRLHLKRLRKKLNESRPLKIAARECRQRQNVLQVNVRGELAALQSVTEIEQYVRNHFGRIMIAFNGGGQPVIHALLNDLKMLSFELQPLRFSESASNTHCKPRNGVTNWDGRTPGAPSGYPGFSGTVKYELNFNPERSAERGNLVLDPNNGLRWAGIHTGGGGGRGGQGVYKYEYGVTLFLSDFEGLQCQYFKDKLAGKMHTW